MAYRKFNPLATDGVLYSDSGEVVNSTAAGTTGQVLTATTGSAPTWQAASGGSITIDGDTGSATGSTITFDANTNSGGTVLFSASGSTVDLLVTDANKNTFVGKSSGLPGITGAQNTFLGQSIGTLINSGTQNTMVGLFSGNVLQNNTGNTGVGGLALSQTTGTAQYNTAVGLACLSGTNGNNNTALGTVAGQSITTGSNNSIIGYQAASNYVSSESSNVIINNPGVAAESNVIRIGTQGSGAGQQNTCYIAGITGVTVSSAQNVVIDTSTGQLGTIASVGKPAWQVTLSANIPAVTGDGTNYPIIYDDVLVDIGSNYNAGTGIYTFPISGLYQMNVQYFLYVSSGASTSTLMFGWYQINGATFIRAVEVNPNALGLTLNNEFVITTSFMHNATAGDTIQIFIDLNAGTKNIGVAGTGDPSGCTFSGFLVH